MSRERGYTAEEVARWHPELGTVLGIPSPHDVIPGTLTVHQTWVDTQPPSGSVAINDGNANTSTRQVTLSLRANDHFGSGVVQMRIKNGGGDSWTE